MSFVTIGSINVSLFENGKYNQMRSINISDEYIDRLLSLEDNKKVLPYINDGKITVYYRKCDLDYFNFENIKDKSDIPIGEITFSDVDYFINGSKCEYYYESTINPDLLASFLYMDDEFEIPSNNQSRGGKRAIFFLNQLAKVITNDESIAKFCIEYCNPDGTFSSEDISKYKLSDHNGEKNINKHIKIEKSSKIVQKSHEPVSSELPKPLFQPNIFGKELPKPLFQPNIFTQQQLPVYSGLPPFTQQQLPVYSGFSSFAQQQLADIDLEKSSYFKPNSPVSSPKIKQFASIIDESKNLNPERKMPISELDSLISDNIIMSYDDYDIEHPSRFVGCNSVFRLNKFSPDDSSFKFHFDTPFYDRDNNHVSLFTILIYLTSGSNPDGVLKIYDGTECSIITEIEAGDVIIFNQQYAHIGNPFIEGDKVFLRSELIFEVPELSKNSKIADIFNQACYFQLQSNRLKSGSLQKYSSDLFNETMRLRNSMPPEIKQKYLLVKDENIKFITNGTFYYFAGEIIDQVRIIDYAKIIINNYFNRISPEYTKVLSKIDNPLEFLNMFMFHMEDNEYKEKFPEEPQLRCTCGICGGDSTRSFSYQFEQEYIDIVNTIPSSGSAIQLENDIFIDDARVVMKSENSGLVVFKTREKGFNFASCQGIYEERIEDFNVIDKTGTLYDLPPIEFKFDGGYIFTIDMFKCGFKYSRPVRYVTFA